MTDGFNRQINYARISVTDLCDLRCAYCMPEGVKKKTHGQILTIEELLKVSEALSELGVNKQRITGGEPLVRRGIEMFFSEAGKNPLINTFAITTNGQTLKKQAKNLKSSGVNAINISIDTLNADKFKCLTKLGELNKTLEGIDAAIDAGFDTIKLNAVLLKDVNDDEIYDLATFAKTRNVPIRFIELMPFMGQEYFANKYFISSNDIVKRFNLQMNKQKTQCKKVSVYEFSDGVEVQFISPVSAAFCSECNRVRITADGKLLNCLHESCEYDLRPFIMDKVALKEYITQCVRLKPARHHILEGVLQDRPMENIGG